MFFLVMKMLLLLLVSALFGALLMRMWLMSRYEEVTEHWSYWNARNEELSSRLDGIDGRLATARASVDLGPVQSRLDGLDTRLSGLSMPSMAPVTSGLAALSTKVEGLGGTDLSPVHTRLEGIEGRLAGLDLGTIHERLSLIEGRVGTARVDLSPVQQRLDLLESSGTDLTPVLTRLSAIEARLGDSTGGSPDLGPLHARLEAIEAKLGKQDLSSVSSGIAALSSTVGALNAPNMEPVHARLAAIESKLSPVDLAPVRSHLSTVERKVDAIHCEPADLTAVLARLEAMEAKMAAPAPVVNPVDAARRHDNRNLLLRPAFGAPDDLKVISGVGPKLEGMLHGIGVYYFWQVSEWSLDDVNFVDDQLEVFKGRIERDEWVTQAGELAAQPHAAKRP